MKTPSSISEKYEYVKSIMTENEKAMVAVSKDTDREKLMAKLRIAYFFKNLVWFNVTKDPTYLQHVKALASGVDADGGYTVPPEFRALLIEDIQDRPVMRNMVTVFPMGSNSLELPSLASGVKTSWGSENTSISTTTARFGTLTFTPYRLNSLLYTSRELVADSAFNVVQLITRLFGEAVAREEDRVIINGSGTGQPKGILQETLSGIDNGNDDSTLAVNVKKLPFRLGTAYRTKAKWVMNSLSLSAVATLRDSQNNFLFKEGIEGLTPHRLAGYEVHEQNDMPLDTLLFGDFSYYYLADREQISVETTTEGAGTFEKHQVAIKVVERIDGKVALTRAFRTLTNCGID
jgi:HK97 family phage major capsid protein